MQGFIELKTLTDDSAILLPIAQITAVVERDYGTFIETGVDGKGRTIGIPVADSYEQIKQKILNSR